MISQNFTPEKYLGNGSTTNFAFDWAIIAEANIRVYLEDVTTGVQTLQTLGTDFTIDSGWDNDGGTIEFTTAPSSSYYVVISRDIPETQEVQYKTSSGFSGKVVENSYDKLTVMVQDAKEVLSRCLRYPVGTDSSTENEVAVPSTTAGYPYWDGSAYSIVTALTGTGDYPADITRGTDASKSASPSVGDIHIATDTQKLYICFTDGTWTDYNQEIIDRNVLQIQNIAQENMSLLSVRVRDGFDDQAQSITPNRDMYVSNLEVRWTSITGSSDFKVRIETDNAGEPSGTLATGFGEVVWTVSGSGWKTLSLGTVGRLVAGTRYWIVIVADGFSDEGYIAISNGIEPIPDEKLLNDKGSGWVETFPDRALVFRLNNGLSLSAGDCVGVGATLFEKSQADSEANSNAFIGIVKAVTTVSYYSYIDIVMSGVITGQTGLTSGALYYLDPATAGAYTATKPTGEGQYVKPVMIATSETTGIVINQVGVEIVASTTDMVFWENSAVGYENEVVYNQ